ncbi:aminodeoxychorismate lyase [Blochmannia endosymbiont of Camponotus (Colobopsis) obliquus]|uniref:aminodeoxychorismate lyase n=1 Tax=Blochmannia endosymbiont of Camponotus (Colobopsis) obliquus TaxID=1505597 RepID=UPI00061A6F7B|nr:aminodeoxychorismate lyase [Blochmannia endosymbiont of Camponotus (Colobopsis) obliquus]AKC60561.1 aminodeoxychorismate lyase [Blochmannia endosymbiont of Camponotus (Colobopsis) obliquus]
MYWINGVFHKKLSILNRIIQFGDGFFTTARLQNSMILLLDWHIERLETSSTRLLFNNINLSLLRQEMQVVADKCINGVIKVIVSRGNGKWGYNFDDKSTPPVRIIVYNPMPKYYTTWLKNGVKLSVSPIRLARDIFFSGIKHLNRLEQIIINAYCNKNISDMALVLDTEDNIIECCNANIFWRRDMKVFTPSLTHAGVFGVMRRKILTLLPTLGYQYQEIMVGLEGIYEAEEVFITNSLLPVVSVNSIEQHVYSNKKLFNLLNFYIANE